MRPLINALIASVFAVCITIASQIQAEDSITLSKSAAFSNIDSISVVIGDSVVDGCWTNLKEVREYAEEKLRGLRLNVVDFDGEYELQVNSIGQGKPFCHAYIEVALVGSIYTEGGLVGKGRLSYMTALIYGNATVKLNSEILNFVQGFIK